MPWGEAEFLQGPCWWTADCQVYAGVCRDQRWRCTFTQVYSIDNMEKRLTWVSKVCLSMAYILAKHLPIIVY